MPQDKNPPLPKSRLRYLSSLLSRPKCNAAQCFAFVYTAQSIVVFIRLEGPLRHFGFPPAHPEVEAGGGQEERKLSQTCIKLIFTVRAPFFLAYIYVGICAVLIARRYTVKKFQPANPTPRG
jgi:hypothetical protein